MLRKESPVTTKIMFYFTVTWEQYSPSSLIVSLFLGTIESYKYLSVVYG